MRYQIDQSIKIEDTNRTTYVALANGEEVITYILGKEKRKLKRYFRQRGKPIIFKTYTFSLLCAKALAHTNVKDVEIDREYKGHEINIKSYITKALKFSQVTAPNISFANVGRRVNAHKVANESHKRNIKPKEGELTAEDVIYLFEKLEK